jgi:translation initiation factor IF-2
MAESQDQIRLSKAAKEFNVGVSTLVEFLSKKNLVKESLNPNSKISPEVYEILEKEFMKDKVVKEESRAVGLTTKSKREAAIAETKTPEISAAPPAQKEKDSEPDQIKELINKQPEETPILTPEKPEKEVVVVEIPAPAPAPAPEVTAPDSPESDVIKAKPAEMKGPVVKGKIDLSQTGKKKSGKFKDEKPSQDQKPAHSTQKEVPQKPKQTEAVKENIAPAQSAPELPPVAVENQKPDEPVRPPEPDVHVTQYEKLEGPTILGKIELKDDKKKATPVASSSMSADQKKKRKRIKKGPITNVPDQSSQAGHSGGQQRHPRSNDRKPDRRQPAAKQELTQEEIDNKIKETLARLSGQGKSASSKYRRQKRDNISLQIQEELEQQAAGKRNLRVTEFISANELASLMNVPVNQVISTCMSLGMFVSINQRLSAEIITIVAEEFGFKVEFVSAETQVATVEEIDNANDLKPRPPIVTVMGHVDHGKTSLLDHIRKSNVIAGEAGGITQHIGAYNVELDNGKRITFLDTPGHEAFTAMRARGAQVTDIVIIVVAADDSVMPQTREAINHAQAAGVPIIIAINKIDKPGANPDKIREELSGMNILVEEWGGKYQCQEISAKKGLNIELLLEKVLLEAEMLDLKANPTKNAVGTVIESSLDKGRGYVTTVLVQAGTMQVGDILLAGSYSGKVKALFNERGTHIKQAGPSMPVQLLGLSGAPTAGDKFKVMDDEREAKDIALKRLQLLREQGYRTQKHITLDEIGRRLAIGDFKELNIIVKGDVDGSVEALTDSLLKLTTEKIQVNVIHKSVGQVTESDVLLASASNAIIIGFQVRPSSGARKLAEQEQIDIRLYSVIYDAINEVKSAMEGMLAPDYEEKITCNIEVRETFKISKVGTIAGCMVLDGKVNRNTKVRLIRDGIVIFSGELGSLKRFKDDVREVSTGYECGLNLHNFNDIKVGDIIEGYEMVEVKR